MLKCSLCGKATKSCLNCLEMAGNISYIGPLKHHLDPDQVGTTSK